MTRTSRCVAIGVLGLLAAMAGIHAQPNDQAGVMLQTAIQTEIVDGNLRTAIELYQEIVARFGNERPVAATALLHLGHSYEKLGEPGPATRTSACYATTRTKPSRLRRPGAARGARAA